MISVILFILALGVTSYLAFAKYRDIFNNISLGSVAAPEPEVTTSDRVKRMALIALGQKKMFKRWIPAVLHGFIYVAFLFTQIELVEIFLDGLTGQHRILAPYLGGVYTVLINFIEVLSLLAFVATVIFLWRRNALKLPRLNKSEMVGWPTMDANLILVGEILLIIGIFSMNSADGILQGVDPVHYPDTGSLMLSGALGHSLLSGWSEGALMALERFGWWLHLLVVLGFIVYLPYSKHLHIVFAFIHTFKAPFHPRGRMKNMPEIAKEVRVMLGLDEDTGGDVSDELPDFGANDIFGLSTNAIRGAYACTECGRCTDNCPANVTGKQLSPRKIMMDIRDRADEVRQHIKQEHIKEETARAGIDDGKSLFDYISQEEIYACTTCNACVEACPVLINPLEPILELRRYDILTNSAGPSDWMPMFNSLESTQSPWQIPDPRDHWTTQMTDA